MESKIHNVQIKDNYDLVVSVTKTTEIEGETFTKKESVFIERDNLEKAEELSVTLKKVCEIIWADNPIQTEE